MPKVTQTLHRYVKISVFPDLTGDIKYSD